MKLKTNFYHLNVSTNWLGSIKNIVHINIFDINI